MSDLQAWLVVAAGAAVVWLLMYVAYRLILRFILAPFINSSSAVMIRIADFFTKLRSK